MWQLAWERYLPVQFDDITVDIGTFDDALPFVREHYPTIFASQAERFLPDPMTPAKARFASTMDAFLCRDGDRVIGVMLANPLDWSSYYLRSAAILPKYRNRRILTRLFELTYEPLRAVGVERIETDCSPSNLPVMRMLTHLGWYVTATHQSERWGLMVHSTKFLRDEADATFVRQFCSTKSEPIRPRIHSQ